MATVVTSQANPLAYVKAIVALVGSIATGLLAVYTADTPVGQVLTVLVIIATSVGTWFASNAIVDPTLADGVPDGEEGEVTYVDPDAYPEPYEGSGQPLYTDVHEPARMERYQTLMAQGFAEHEARAEVWPEPTDDGSTDPNRY